MQAESTASQTDSKQLKQLSFDHFLLFSHFRGQSKMTSLSSKSYRNQKRLVQCCHIVLIFSSPICNPKSTRILSVTDNTVTVPMKPLSVMHYNTLWTYLKFPHNAPWGILSWGNNRISIRARMRTTFQSVKLFLYAIKASTSVSALRPYFGFITKNPSAEQRSKNWVEKITFSC